MIATFLQAGLGSPRATERLRELLAERALHQDLLTGPDLTNDTDNRSRSTLLGAWYGWPGQGLFEGLPVGDIDWWSGVITRTDLPRVECIRWVVDEGYVPSRPLGTHYPPPAGRPLAQPVDDIAELIARGGSIPRPIVICPPVRDRVVILDGHTRLSALMSLGERGPTVTPVLVGLTERAAEWSEWGQPAC